MALQTAEEVLKTIPKPRSKFKKVKEQKPEIVVVCGSTKWTDKKLMKRELAKLPKRNVAYVIIGTSKGSDQLAVSVAKELGLCVVQVHPIQSLGSSATYIRNEMVIGTFKPTQVMAFHDDLPNSVSSAQYLKLGKKKGIPCHHFSTIKPKSKKKLTPS
jgi:hypothetical protein